VLDSLRYWVEEMHVDGFRFDLATVLARELHEVNRLGTFFDIIHQDPVLSQVKLIAEPWDVGPGGYQVGNFPIGWAEWNGKYRDAVRKFWKGEQGVVPEFASRLSGSSDIYQWSDRQSYASVNFVVAHDGFTMADLVSYEQKHNEANGEDNKDGANDNHSRNWGAEGPSDIQGIIDIRARSLRNMMATLAFSQGVPMIAHGDEIARSQKGNNNAYAQDNELTWMNWNLDDFQRKQLEFTRKAFAIRHSNPVLRRRSFFHGMASDEGQKDLVWIRADGNEMTEQDWQNPGNHTLGMLINGDATDEMDDRGRPIKGDTMLLIAHAGDHDVDVTLPRLPGEGVWLEMVDTAELNRGEDTTGPIRVAAYSFLLLRHGRDRRMESVHHPAAVNTAAVSPAAAEAAATTGGASLQVEGGPNDG
jgi:glycogen operon protein